MTKRILTLLLVLALCLGILAGCSEAPAGTTAAPDTTGTAVTTTAPEETTVPPKVTVDQDAELELDGKKLLIETRASNIDYTFLKTAINYATGCEVDVEIYGFAVQPVERPIPALTVLSGYTEANYLGRQDAYLNLYDYMDQLPNVQAAMEAYPELFAKCRYSEDALYAVPVIRNGDNGCYGFLYRQDIMKELELDYWTDWDSFYAALKAMKKAYPDSYPLCLYGLGGSSLSVLNELGVLWGCDYYDCAFDHDTKTWFYGGATDAFREMLSKLSLLLKEELLHPDSLTFDFTGRNEAVASGVSFVTYAMAGTIDTLNSALQEQDASASLTYGVPVAMSENGTAASHQTSTAYCWGVSKRNEDLTSALVLLDWLYSEEGMLTTCWGIEGVSFEYDEAGDPYYIYTEGFTEEDAGVVNARYQLSGLMDFNAILATYSETAQACIQAFSQYATQPNRPTMHTLDANALMINDALKQQSKDNISAFLRLEQDVNDDAAWQAHLDSLKDWNLVLLLQTYQEQYEEGGWLGSWRYAEQSAS